ncbi:MAG: HAMP domain-containing histidine kinase [Bacteroidetes bacterium]|nr:HAMP domain-containing histidine kinase [Bacteroidota bacterium]
MKRSTTIFFYFLGGYVLLQFTWWAYHLIELTKGGQLENDNVNRKMLMIMSEGLVFLLIILVGLWRIRYSMKKDMVQANRQKNFLLSVTHELKTPLASNKLMLQTILKHKLDQEKQDQILEKAISENVRLEGMIDNILNATKLDHNSLQTHHTRFSVNQLVNKVVERYLKTYQISGLKVIENSQSTTLADENMIETLLVNLIDNAIKYCDTNPEITIEICEKNELIFIDVCDNGLGIHKNMQSEIFKKFVRVGDENVRSKKGSGLGLYIASEFAKVNNGRLFLLESSTKGSIFRIELKKA